MGHWSVEDFVKEVHDVNQYIQERPQAVMLASSLASGLVEKIELTNMWTCGNLLEVPKAVEKHPVGRPAQKHLAESFG